MNLKIKNRKRKLINIETSIISRELRDNVITYCITITGSYIAISSSEKGSEILSSFSVEVMAPNAA